MLTQIPEWHQHMECPRCGKHSVVRHGDSTYVCINCGFRCDVSEQPDESNNALMATAIATLLTLLLIL
ncbi:MAG: hypothetical protein ACFE0I_16325 [Elainellaceae cyanobacterium]